MVKIIAVKVPDELYTELEKRAKEEGFSLVSEYLLHLISQALGRGGPTLRSIEERLERIESGELPPKLYERIWSIVKSALQEEGVSSIDVEKVVARVERKVMDMVNPWTGKVDKLAQQVADILERLENLEEQVKRLSEEVQKLREQHEQREVHEQKYVHAHHYGRRFQGEEGRRRRRTAIEWLRERKVLFESELLRLRDRDAFFEKLKREGAIVIELPNERVAVDPDFWEEFKKRISRISTPKEEEVQVLLRDQTMFKLFQKLKDEGLIYFDVTAGAWKVTKDLP